ncbi:integrator complex [Plasmopara halstedii]|uniref:Integrator complex n=1 Tax=Plasmopara halstedii TaxID=4781 RepID=A0A0P1ADG9_PLAHL|nr:integrator complex [Plasmopara halstedii]CEG38960.1 integrator complex [Plasmopara halstedii]|eukprot:XP_024575329.1 integrator complex [Plasmopara halstedii]
MKVIQLGGSNDGLCHFLSLGGLEMLLDCGVKLQSLQKIVQQDGSSVYRLDLPKLNSVDPSSLDVVLISNHQTLLALPILTEFFGFTGQIYATQLTLDFGRVFLEELAALTHGNNFANFTYVGVTDVTELPMYSLEEIKRCCEKVNCVEYGEVVKLGYGVQVTALSSGFTLGASTWLVEGPNDRLAYVAGASGDYNRHPKELDLLPLVDCETLLLSNLKPDRDPHSNTERMVERVLSEINKVLERGGVCLLPIAPCGIMFDLIEAVYAACVQSKQNVPMYFISDFATRVMELTQLGAEWLCEKKIEKLYAGEDAFLHESLRKKNLFHAVSNVSAVTAATFQNGSILFVGHPSLKFGHAPHLINMLGNESRNAVLLTDPSVDATKAFANFQDLPIEKIACPIDPRLSCGDANQFIARCCPHNLIVPYEFTIAQTGTAGDGAETSSHFARILPLHELTTAKSKIELQTFPIKQFEPIIIEKPSKYFDGKLDPKLAAQATITEVNGKAAACISGVLRVRRGTFMLEPSCDTPFPLDNNDASKLKSSGKRKASLITEEDMTRSLRNIVYKEPSSFLMGQVSEETLEKQVKTHDPRAQVYISQGQGDADVFMSIPSLDARITLWKETGKTLIETEKEDARALLTSFILAQLVVVTQDLCRELWKMERVEDGLSLNIVPPLFHAGISNKFTKRHHNNFRDTTLTAASAAKERAERKLVRQADAIEKQQQKIDNEMKRIAEMTQNLHRQQLREANRLRNRLVFAASKLQGAYRRHLRRLDQQKQEAAEVIQTVSRGFLARRLCCALRLERELNIQNRSAKIIARLIRRFTARIVRARELKLRHWAVCSIQSIVRMAAARSHVQARRKKLTEAKLQFQAAVIIQCNTRAFLTRLIYLDVLYLICRIQAAMRGFLVRHRLRWLRAVDDNAISILQAHVRGFLARRRYTNEQVNNQKGAKLSSRSSKLFTLSSETDLRVPGCPQVRASTCSIENVVKLKTYAMSTRARLSTRIGWQPKRSYWLPAGASFNQRLPMIPVLKRLMVLDQVTAGNKDFLGDDFQLLNQSWTPKKRPQQKPSSVRLSPVVLPSSSVASFERVDQNASRFDEEERIRQKEDLKQKLTTRRNAEKRRQAHYLKLQSFVEHEANERRLMEREEKLVRLQHKVLRRRSREGKIRQLTHHQRQEERERLAMVREERHQRLHLKFCARQRLKKRQQLAMAPTTFRELELQPPTTSKRYEKNMRSNSRQTVKKSHESRDDNVNKLSSLNIIPTSMKRRKRLAGSKKSGKLVHAKKKRIRGKNMKSKTIAMRLVKPLENKIATEENVCEYGEEFEEIVDEAALTSLM